jgi:RimJ/RimL family protein N-acetyltransferase
MKQFCLETERLELVAGNLQLSEAELANLEKFSHLLNAQIIEWPPPLNDENSMRFVRDFYARNPHTQGWGSWYFLLKATKERQRIAIGNGGFKGQPHLDGTVEIGYSILTLYQNQGYASEAVRALVSWAFEHHNVKRIIAETLPELKASIRVLEKNKFEYIGEGSELGVIRFNLDRAAYFES